MKMAAKAMMVKMIIGQKETEKDASRSADGFLRVFWKEKNAAMNSTNASKPKAIKMMVCSTFTTSPLRKERSAVDPISNPMPARKSALRKNNREPSSDGRWVWAGFNLFFLNRDTDQCIARRYIGSGWSVARG